MNSPHKLLGVLGLTVSLSLVLPAAAQNPPAAPSSPPKESTNPNPQSRITVEITGGDKDVPVENASVYFTYVEEHKIKKNKTLEINVKTNQDGVAHIPDAPLGHVRIQVIAEGWKTYGRWFDLDDPKQVIKIHLERPPKWY
jgi:hypothetical protein